MFLNDEQKAMMDGKCGRGAAYAMEIQFALGEAFDAPDMVPITRAHVALSNQEADLWFAEKLLAGGAHCRIAPDRKSTRLNSSHASFSYKSRMPSSA